MEPQFPFRTLQQGNRKQGHPFRDSICFANFSLDSLRAEKSCSIHFPAGFFLNFLWMVNVKQPWTPKKEDRFYMRVVAWWPVAWVTLGKPVAYPKCHWQTPNRGFRPRSQLLHIQPWALRRYFRAVLLKGSLIISPFSKLWGLDRPKKEWMLPTTKDADLPQGSGVLEKDTNVADNGGPRKKRRLSRNGTCITVTGDPLQSELNFHSHKKQKTLFNVGEVENVASTMAEPQRKANFSAYGNHFHERSPLANNSAKPGQAKKLVIKNFKGGSF